MTGLQKVIAFEFLDRTILMPESFSDTADGLSRGSEVDTEFVFWRPGQIMASSLAAPSASFIIKYPASRMGCKLLGLGYLFPQTKHLFYSERILMPPLKRLCER